MRRRLSHWGWGYEDRFPERAAREALAQRVRLFGGFDELTITEPTPLAEANLPEPRLEADGAVAAFATATDYDRACRTYGRSYFDIARGFAGDFAAAPDVVLEPRTEEEVQIALAWACDRDVAIVPYGGGTSVVRGVEVTERDAYRGVACLDMRRLDQVLEVERSSLSARIQAGATGPRLEAQLRDHGLTLRFFPQSFELSTLGGWIATRAGGHFATHQTHIDDLVQSTRMLTPRGVVESRRLPGSGAGPSPDRMVMGSEGALGVITESWVRVRPRPIWRASASVRFRAWSDVVSATRLVAQSGLWPSNCRVLDQREALLNRVVTDGSHVLLLGFESADHDVRPRMERALEIALGRGGTCPDGATYSEREPDHARDARGDDAERWREAFLDAPYIVNSMASLGVIADTFETACTWDRFEALHRGVISAVKDAMRRVCGGGVITCRFTHVYPDGPAPYFTFVAPTKAGHGLSQWAEIKSAASDALLEHGGTITHHHAVGRTHRPWYERQRPALFGEALTAMKRVYDPAGVLNPGALLEAPRAARGAG